MPHFDGRSTVYDYFVEKLVDRMLSLQKKYPDEKLAGRENSEQQINR